MGQASIIYEQNFQLQVVIDATLVLPFDYLLIITDFFKDIKGIFKYLVVCYTLQPRLAGRLDIWHGPPEFEDDPGFQWNTTKRLDIC